MEGPRDGDTLRRTHAAPAYPERAAWGTAPKLRAWQQEALDSYFSTHPKDFLAVATPGAGKTTFALRVASMLIEAGTVNRVTIVAPTDHLKRQWADAAARVGIAIDPNFKNADGQHGRGFIGVAVTYAQVASKPMLHRAKTEAARTLVILDEIHHGGEALSWGDGLREAFDPAARRLSLTGTPFRSDTSPIPFVEYAEDRDGIRRSKADYTYGYGKALRDHVVRPVMFMAYSGQMRWRTSAGDEMAASLGESAVTKDITSQAWRTALNPDGEWIPAVLRGRGQAAQRGPAQRPDAGGLVIATDHEDARAYAGQLKKITGESPTVDPLRRRQGLEQDRGIHRQREALDGGRPDGVRRRGRPAAVRRRLRHLDLHPAVLRPGRGALRACPQARRDGVGLPALGAAADGPGQLDGGRARPRPGPPGEGRQRRPLQSRGFAHGRGEPRGEGLRLPDEGQVRGPRLRRRPSTGCCSTAASSAPAARWARRTNSTSSGIPGLLDAEQVGTLLRQRQHEQLNRKNRRGPAD